MRRRLSVIITVATLVVAGNIAAGTAVLAAEPLAPKSCSNATGDNARFCKVKAGSLLPLELRNLRPTQPSLGYDEVYYKLGRYNYGTLPASEGGPTKGDAINKKYDDWCESYGLTGADADAIETGTGSLPPEPDLRAMSPDYCSDKQDTGPMKTAVVGPGGQMYLTDGHHTFTSFWQMPDGGPTTPVRVKVTDNFSGLSTAQFWKKMKADKKTWLYNVAEEPISPSKLPKQLGLKNFANDPYRGILYFARDIGYKQSDQSPPFQEFYWGDWLRSLQEADPSVTFSQFDLKEGAWETNGSWDKSSEGFLALVRNVAMTINDVCPDDPTISNGLSAQRLGCIDEFGSKTFADVQYGYTNEAGKKPGKVAYSLKYKDSL